MVRQQPIPSQNKSPDPALVALLLVHFHRLVYNSDCEPQRIQTPNDETFEELDDLVRAIGGWIDSPEIIISNRSLCDSSERHPNTVTMDDLERLRLLEFQSDLDLAEQGRAENEQHQKIVQQALMEMGRLLYDAQRELYNLDETKLGSALLRLFQETADQMGNFAQALEESQADASLQDLSLQDFTGSTPSRLITPSTASNNPNIDFDELFQNVSLLLRDFESALRSLSESEAQELASVALGVGHMTLFSLQNAHRQVTPPHVLEALQQEQNDRRLIAMGDDSRNGTSRSLQALPPPPTPKRLRCLWPPLAPMLGETLQWTQTELSQQPWYVPAGLAVTLWPVALGTAIVLPGALLWDHVLQSTYSTFSETEVIQVAELLAAEAFETAKLGLLTTKALAKPAFTVAKLQTKRHLPGLLDAAKDKVSHPISTVQQAAQGALWMGARVVQFAQDQINNHTNGGMNQRQQQELLVQ